MRPAARYTREFCGATFREDEPRASLSSSEARFATCHCHCPSSRGEFEDVVAAPSTTACDLCERLRGRTGRGRDPLVDAKRTENGLVVGGRYERLRRKREGDYSDSSSSASDSNAIDRKHDRTSRCDRVPLSGSSARCASNVVRWNLAGRCENKRSITWRGFFSIIFLILSVPGLAAAQRTTTIGPSNKDGGKYAAKIFVFRCS